MSTERVSIDELDEYERIGDPALPYEPNRRDQRRQRQAEEIREAARQAVAQMPPPSPATVERVAAALKSIRSNPRQPWQLMRWRLRLYCGHLVECTAHYTHKTVHAAFTGRRACPQCGRDPVVIVAAAPIGRVGPPPDARTRSRRASSTRAQRAGIPITAIELDNPAIRSARRRAAPPTL